MIFITNETNGFLKGLLFGIVLSLLAIHPLIEEKNRFIEFQEELLALSLDMSVTRDILTQLDIQKKEK